MRLYYSFLRKYGPYLYMTAIVIFLIDDYATDWHDHGHESTLRIIMENMTEDTAAFLLGSMARWWEKRPIRILHAECPMCHFKWIMHPRKRVLFCPRCGVPEPS